MKMSNSLDAKHETRGAFEGRERTPVSQEGEKSLTQQQFKDEADINHITEQYLKKGQLGNPNATRQPIFGDFSSTSFQEMQNKIIDAEQAFAALPGRLRARFQNSPFQLLRFCENPNNKKEAIRLGLIEPDPEPTPAGQQVLKLAEMPPVPKADPEAQPPFKGARPSSP